MLIAVNYHYVRAEYPEPFPGIHGITPDALAAQVRVLTRLGPVIDARTLRSAIDGGDELPPVCFVLTFDDGLREHYEQALPVLDALGVPALFFINTGPLRNRTVSRVHKIHLLRSQTPPNEFERALRRLAEESGEPLSHADEERAVGQYQYDVPEVARLKYLLNFAMEASHRDALIDRLFRERYGAEESRISEELYLTRAQVVELSERDAIGSHAHEHIPLETLEPDAASALVHEASKCIESWTGKRPVAFSHPYGSAPGWLDAQLRSVGLEFAFTTVRAPNLHLTAPLRLNRYDSNDVPGGKRGPENPEKWVRALAPGHSEDGA
jgi:peptidoglycan/xylan/chitin deacetylase (PgdA/CDA1 family)